MVKSTMTNVRELKKKLKRLEEENSELHRKFEEARQEIKELKSQLSQYKNSNTPSSANKHIKPNTQGLKASGKRKQGAPKGHPGINHGWKVGAVPREIHADKCPFCNSKDIEKVGERHQQLDEMPPDIKPVTIDVDRDICRCNNCNHKFIATDGRTPLQGRFGLNLIILVIFLKFIVRGVLRKTAMFLTTGFGASLAPATVQAIIARVARAGEVEYEMLKKKIRAAKLLYIDETSFSVLGKNWWVWVFRSDTDLLLVIRNSRGNNVLEEILGRLYSGIVICDCWRAYDFLSFARIQRCWSHLLRKSKELCSTVAGRHFHEKLSELFDEIKRFNSTVRSDKQRARKYAFMTAKLQRLIAYYSQYDECKEVIKYIEFHIESWFTCIRYNGVEPTNNFAEQAIRETVMVRKIIGAFRSIKGTRAYETLASLIATWQMQKKDLRVELYRMLSLYMC